jgi:hypothetical protein
MCSVKGRKPGNPAGRNQYDDAPPIERVIRWRVQIDDLLSPAQINAPRVMQISLPRVKGYFEEEPYETA